MTTPVYDISCLSNTELLFSFLDVKPAQGRMTAKTMSEHVTAHRIVTNNGAKTRTVFAPDDVLKWVQNRIRHGLLAHLPVDDCVHGFVRARGIVTNARAHAGRRAWVLNVDLKDFFPSISYQRVDDFFRHRFAAQRRVSGYLTRLTTFSGHLAQGFTTSPEIANFVAWHMDRRMSGLAARHGLAYTRYADDLTMSCPDGDDVVEIGSIIRKMFAIIRGEGFVVNKRKIAVMKLGRRQRVTGLVIGDQGTISVDRRIRRLLRAAAHHWPQQTPERRLQIMGMIAHVQNVDPVCAAQLLAAIAEFDTNNPPADTWARPVSTSDFSEDMSSVSVRHRFVSKSRRRAAQKGSK